MKKLLHWFLAFLVLFNVVACQKKIEPYTGPDIELNLYYYEYCPRCHAFMENGIPALEEAFGDHLTVNLYDIEDPYDNNVERYAQEVMKLEGFDESLTGYAPFIVFEGLFAKIGYDDGTIDYYIEDVKRAVQHEKLGSFLDVDGDRFLFKES